MRSKLAAQNNRLASLSRVSLGVQLCPEPQSHLSWHWQSSSTLPSCVYQQPGSHPSPTHTPLPSSDPPSPSSSFLPVSPPTSPSPASVRSSPPLLKKFRTGRKETGSSKGTTTKPSVTLLSHRSAQTQLQPRHFSSRLPAALPWLPAFYCSPSSCHPSMNSFSPPCCSTNPLLRPSPRRAASPAACCNLPKPETIPPSTHLEGLD